VHRERVACFQRRAIDSATGHIGKGETLMAKNSWVRVWAGLAFCAVALQARADGALDASFGAQGRFIGAVVGGREYGYATGLQVQANGKLVLGNSTHITGNTCSYAMSLVRILPAAAGADSAFGNNGQMDYCFTAQMPAGYFDMTSLSDLVGESGGRMLAVGGTSLCTSPTGGCTKTDVALLRVNANGIPDTTFNGTGKLLIGSGTTIGDNVYRSAIGAAVDSNGTIFVVGTSSPPGSKNLALWAVRDNGSLIQEFADTSASNGDPTAIAVQPDGKILTASTVSRWDTSTTPNSVDRDCVISRYYLQGTSIAKDTTFGVDGSVYFAFQLGGPFYKHDICSSLSVQHDGRIVFAGTSSSDSAGGSRVFAGRMLADGALDPTFLSGNVRIFYFETGSDGMQNVSTRALVQADGKIIVVGSASTAANSGRLTDFAAVRFLPDGSFDYGGFAGLTPGSINSRSMVDFGPITGGASDDTVSSAVLDGGHLVMAGGDTKFKLARLEADIVFGNGFE
jgi:uncharacterized delta-60 repeat protein